jgi:hypothetical protein
MSTDTAFYLLVKQFHAAWQANNGVASLLSLDMTGVFDRVVHVQLLHNLRKGCILNRLVSFIPSFLSDWTTSLCFPGFSSTSFFTEQDVPQSSPISLIFFLFYDADLVDVSNSSDIQMFWLLGRALSRSILF